MEQYLYDERFAGRMEEVFNEVFLTRSGETFFQLEEAGMGGLDPSGEEGAAEEGREREGGRGSSAVGVCWAAVTTHSHRQLPGVSCISRFEL